ncbi:zf-HC2 domain-containing protein [Streptomyces sp. Pv4-95]|uniref:zf-HC2 domain-containing protein n=1 Tax=Streptomyces sp. Pv4-95 TaxID=3049543 RepID=UPI00389151AA
MSGPDEWDGHRPDDPREHPGRPERHGPPSGSPDPQGPQGRALPGRPRIPSPRSAAEDFGPLPDATPPTPAPETERNGADSRPESGAESGARSGPEPGADSGPRSESESFTVPVALPVPTAPAAPPHRVLKSLLGAWALAACSAEETAAVEAHLTDCAACADEALRLRDAVGLLHPADSLDLDPLLRSRVLEGCLGRRPARIPVPEWAMPYDAETAKLDALLRDMGEAEWRAPVRLRWFEHERPVERETTVAGVIGHLMAVDGLLATALGLPDPLGGPPPGTPPGPAGRTEGYWQAMSAEQAPSTTLGPWRDQSHALIRTVSFTGRAASEIAVPYGGFKLPLRDSFLDRAFECWVHAGDIAEAVDYPYEPPAAGHVHRLVDLAARLLPVALADRRRAGLAAPPQRLVEAGAPGRTLHLEVEGNGGGHWYIALDSPAALGTPDHTVAHIALDSSEFCQLAAGHVSPEEAAAGQRGERDAIREVLFATASLSRL